MSEINDELQRLKKSLETLDSYTKEIGTAKASASSVVKAINKVQKSYSLSVETIDKEVGGLIKINKPLTEQLKNLTIKLDQTDFPSRLDKVDATIAGIYQGVMNLQGRLDNTDRELRDQIGKVKVVINQGTGSLQGRLDATERDLRRQIGEITTALGELEVRQKTMLQEQKKEIQFNQSILFAIGVIAILILVVCLVR